LEGKRKKGLIIPQALSGPRKSVDLSDLLKFWGGGKKEKKGGSLCYSYSNEEENICHFPSKHGGKKEGKKGFPRVRKGGTLFSLFHYIGEEGGGRRKKKFVVLCLNKGMHPPFYLLLKKGKKRKRQDPWSLAFREAIVADTKVRKGGKSHLCGTRP